MHIRLIYWPLALSILLTWNNAATSRDTDVALKSGIDRSAFDLSVKPGDDFFQYVNGNWIKHNPIPPEYSRWGAFPKLRDDNLVALHEILDDLPKQTDSSQRRTSQAARFLSHGDGRAGDSATWSVAVEAVARENRQN